MNFWGKRSRSLIEEVTLQVKHGHLHKVAYGLGPKRIIDKWYCWSREEEVNLKSLIYRISGGETGGGETRNNLESINPHFIQTSVAVLSIPIIVC